MDNLKASIVRIRRENGLQVVGVGFLVNTTEKIVVSCAHVVNTAIDKVDNLQIPSEVIFLDFPFLTKGRLYRSRTTTFHPKQNDESGDVATLQLLDDLPSDAQAAKLIIAANHVDNEFSVFGFPQSFEEDGRYVEGKLQERLVNGQIQAIGLSSFGYFVEQGFSMMNPKN